MQKVKLNEIVMKPRWYFILGSLLSVIGLISFSIAAIFLINLTLFLIKQHGPMGEWRLQLMLQSFPLWIPFLALVSLVPGVWLLKQFDFSYKKNFVLIICGFIVSIVLAAVILDYSGLDTLWYKQGPMRRFYQQINQDNSSFQRGQGQRLKQNK